MEGPDSCTTREPRVAQSLKEDLTTIVPLSSVNMFQESPPLPPTVDADSTKPYIYYVFSLYIHTYDEV